MKDQKSIIKVCILFFLIISFLALGSQLTIFFFPLYLGIPKQAIEKNFKGEVIYSAETEDHFAHLTVGETLKFAALARTPEIRPDGLSREQYSLGLRDAVMDAFGLTHTLNTLVGNDFVRGVSGGERKRVSIAEVCLNGCPLQCWDNSTRGLDSATALEFISTLKTSARLSDATIFVSLYQASQDAYDMFDKVTLLYEGRQIYYGSINDAKPFFENMGYFCPDRQTTADFLTSLTSTSERIAQKGMEEKVPRTPDEFQKYWLDSPEFKALNELIDQFNQDYPIGDSNNFEEFKIARRDEQAHHTRAKSPYTISFAMQVRICITRGFQRLRRNYVMPATMLIGNTAIAFIMASIFYNLRSTTSSFFSRGACLFFAVLFNALSSVLEVFNLYEQRPIVEKHNRYALYHPSAEAVASFIVDLPVKTITSIFFNVIIYFISNLRREPGPFFAFLLFSYVCQITMCLIFRTIGSSTRTVSEALTPACLMILALVCTAGFVIPMPNMHHWCKWIIYLNPIAYGFESLMINEFRNRNFTCDQFIPRGGNYDLVQPLEKICGVVGAVPGSDQVQGTDYIEKSFNFLNKHMWRNFGVIMAYMVLFAITYMVAAETIKAKQSKGEVLVFQESKSSRAKFISKHLHHHTQNDLESQQNSNTSTTVLNTPNKETKVHISEQHGIFQWKDVCYDIKIKNENRRILDHVDGWVQPGTLTALMGASGAGKTTLLDVLANRVTMGVVTGDMLVNGNKREKSFQRKTGYVQQQDVHLETSTVREALIFSALLRQPEHVPKQEKIDYVDEVIKILEMEEYKDAVVGVPGEGLNVEQRKRLTIGVELAAKPELLLFLDEPTSGLDSQTAWSICSLMRKLANNGQAILCTIHQPSAMLFQEFDRLLFLSKGGKTVYFGEIGENASTLTSYFERNGADPCPKRANPAEWMLKVIGAAPGSHTDIDWFQTWRNSPELKILHAELDERAEKLRKSTPPDDPSLSKSFAVGYLTQTKLVTQRVFEQYWRTPTYIWSKLFQCVISPLFVGFNFFKSNNDIQGMQNQMFSVFMFLLIFAPLVEQIMPNFVVQRSLYEVRERPSKTYSWVAFILSNIIAEFPWQTLGAVLSFFCYYYPVGYYRNAPSGELHERGAQVFMIIWAFYLFTSTFAHMVIAGIEDEHTGGIMATILFCICLGFCGVLATPEALPGFWIFMYRLSPLTYIVSGMLASGMDGAKIFCSSVELLYIEPPANFTCGSYLEPWVETVGGYVLNPNTTRASILASLGVSSEAEALADVASGQEDAMTVISKFCQFCPINSPNSFLDSIHAYVGDVWRNFGLVWAYIIFNIFGALGLYWLFRVPKGKRNAL